MLFSGCFGDEPVSNQSGTLSGQVIVSGPLRGATLSIDQIDLDTGEVYGRVAETTTDGDGRFFDIPTKTFNGLFRLTANGGSFQDLVTARTVVLDGESALTSLAWVDLLESRDDVLVSPVGHLIEARWQYKRELGDDVKDAAEEAAEDLNRHFAGVDWMGVKPADLSQPATSPTEPVRAALVQAALSILANAIATEAQSSEQEVNAYTLAKVWAEDLRHGVFDGDDGNSDAFGSGLQLAIGCEPVAPADCQRSGTCSLGGCRTTCDQYAGTPRAFLAEAMSQVIRDQALNRTMLTTEDLLPIARAMNDNVDDELFGNACVEQLDRLPPSIIFLTPHEGDYVGGTITVVAQGTDGLDLTPRTMIAGYPDADGDPTNAIASATIDTAGQNGPLVVNAEAIDAAGNIGRKTLTLVADNLAPELTIADVGFFFDQPTGVYWTTTKKPTLRGTVADASPVTVKAIMNGIEIAGTVTGSTWEVTFENTAFELETAFPTQVAVVVTDAAKNQRQLQRALRADDQPPALQFLPSTVTNEATETVTFPGSDENPVHSHDGAIVDLTILPPSCPVLTKHSYLLGATTPAFVTEQPARNPLVYHLAAVDDGFGIATNATKFRVSRREPGGGSTVLVPLSSLGVGTSSPNGAKLFDVAMLAGQIAGLNTTQAIYDVYFETTDRFGQMVNTTRCFDLRLKAPPLHFLPSVPANGHSWALNALQLDPASGFHLIAARMLNSNSTGASLIDQRFTNSTTESVFLTVHVTKPTGVTARRQFAIEKKELTTATDIFCGANPPPQCTDAGADPVPEYVSALSATPISAVMPVKLFELDGAGNPVTEIPCIMPCSASGVDFKFQAPGRAVGAAPRRFVAMTMIAPVAQLQPTDSGQPAVEPFLDLSHNGVPYTGKNIYSVTGCLQKNETETRCLRFGTRRRYRALIHASLEFASNTISSYQTSPTAVVAPIQIAEAFRQANVGWSTSINIVSLP